MSYYNRPTQIRTGTYKGFVHIEQFDSGDWYLVDYWTDTHWGLFDLSVFHKTSTMPSTEYQFLPKWIELA